MSEESRDRLLLPIFVPLFSLAAIAFVVLAFSRVLLAVPHEMATPIAGAMALNVLTAGALIASFRRVRSRALVGVMVVGSLILAGGGVTAMAVSGELQSLLSDEPAHGQAAHGGEEPGAPGATPGETPAEPPAGSPGGTPAAPPAAGPTTTILAKDVAFDLQEITLPADAAATLTFDNQDPVPHNVAIYHEQGGESLFVGEVFSGPATREYQIPAIPAGSYYFQCDVHPNMSGSVTVG